MTPAAQSTQSPPAAQAAAPRTTWRMAAWVAGIFSLVVGLTMLVTHLTRPAIDPLKSPQFKALKEQLRANPGDEPLKQRIRELDLQQRRSYFRQLSLMNSGVYLLLGGLAVFILAGTRVARYQRQPPMPLPRPDAAEQALGATVLARRSVWLAGLVLAVGLSTLAITLTSPLPRRAVDLDKILGEAPTAETAAPDAASAAELLVNWPCFRGAPGAGPAFTNAPSKWDASSGAGVLWKTSVPAQGFNSPIAWGDRIFLSGGDAAQREVLCLDAKTGQITWRQPVANVPGSPAQPPEIPESTGYAAGSMATDGRRVYAFFANGDLAAFTLDGHAVWSKGFGPLKNAYGHATSLAAWRDRLILQLDQGEAEEGKSRLYALDGRTGQVVWQKPRRVGASWASPIVIEAAGKPQVIALAVPTVTAYSAADGAELWRAELLSGEVTPSPAFAGGLLFVASPSDKLVAIRPDGLGDVAKTHVCWTNEDNVPDVTSPVSNGELVFTLSTSGMLTSFDTKDGKKQWEHDFEMECHSSPAVARNRLYVLGQKGTVVVTEAARQFKELFRTQMPDAFHATPAFLPDKMILRGVTNIWCLGEAPAPKP